MRKRSLSWIGVLLTLACLIAAGSAQADVYMKQRQHSDGMQIMGQQKPAEEVIEEIWITNRGFRSDSSKNSMIMLLEEKKMIMINHEDKSYAEMPMNMGEMMSKITEGEDKEEAAAFQNMMKNMMKMEATVQVTGEEQNIKGWKCKKYILTLNTFMGPMTNEIWATEDLKIDTDLYTKFSSTMMAAMPGMESALGPMMEEMKKIKGVQVRTILTQKIMNQTMTSTTELLEFKDGKAPADLLNVPSGYTRKGP